MKLHLRKLPLRINTQNPKLRDPHLATFRSVSAISQGEWDSRHEVRIDSVIFTLRYVISDYKTSDIWGSQYKAKAAPKMPVYRFCYSTISNVSFSHASPTHQKVDKVDCVPWNFLYHKQRQHNSVQEKNFEELAKLAQKYLAYPDASASSEEKGIP